MACDRVGAGKNIAQDRGALRRARYLRFMTHAEPRGGLRHSGIVAEQDHIAVCIQPDPAANGIGLNQPGAT